MKKKVLSLLSVMLILTLLTVPVAAGGGIKFSGVQFSLGSLIASGYVSGIGNTDIIVELEASGNAVIVCTNYGTNDVPGQSYPKLSAIGQQFLPGNADQREKNGKTEFADVETDDPETVSWDVGGCPNSNWTAHVVSISWTNATLKAKDTFGTVLETANYVCDPALQTETNVSCVPVKTK